MAMVGEETKHVLVWRWKNLVFCHIAVLVFLATLTSPVAGDILVVDSESNETSPIFEDLTAAFGPKFPHRGLAARVVYAKPAEACEPVQPPPGPREDKIGWILVVARGGNCGFADKVLAAQQKGYDAVIVHNYQGQEALVRMYGNENGSFINIPSTFVGWQEGIRLKKEYNYTFKRYFVKVIEDDDINYRLYLWPFAVVVAVCFLLVMIFVIVKFVREHASRRFNRLSRRHLKKIPVRKYKKGDYYDTCAICLDEYEEGEKIRVLPCDHVYHTKCIDPWLTKSKQTCPVCKRRVIPGRDADESDSDAEAGNANSSERTPLLAENNSSGGGGSSSTPQYTNTTTPTLHAPGQTRPGDTSVPTDLDGTQGAVGGAGISDQFASGSAVTDVSSQLRQNPGGRRKKNSEWRRAGLWEQEADGSTGALSVHNRAEEPVAETREERRERRRRKKEKKRRAVELSRRTVAAGDGAQEAENGNQGAEPLNVTEDVAVEIAENWVPNAQGSLPAETLPSPAGSIQEAGRGGEDESYINPSYSESEEVVLRNPGRRHEMNDMV